MVRVRTAAAVGAIAALLGGSALVAGAPAAAAQDQPTPIPIVGDFAGDARDEVFTYNPGPRTDYLASLTRTGDTATSTTTPFQVNRPYYHPVAGNFDGDERDEILWYGPGRGADVLWDFTGGTSVTSTDLVVSGVYEPAVGDFDGNGVDDVFWYAEGRSADHLWTFRADGSHASTAQTVTGYYDPVVGSYGTDATDDVFWYNRYLAGPDSLWDFRKGTTAHVTRPYTVRQSYEPLSLDVWGDGAGGGDIFWYGYRTRADYLWNFAGGALASSTADPVNGAYGPIVTGDFFGDGSDDILWYTPGTGYGANVWDHRVNGTALVRDRFVLPASAFDAGKVVPEAPVATASTGGGSGEISVRWDAVAGATGYRVLRDAAGGGFEVVAAFDVTTGTTTAVGEVVRIWSAQHSYVPSGGPLAAPDTSPWFEYIQADGPGERCFQVVAYNRVGAGAPSATTCASPP